MVDFIGLSAYYWFIQGYIGVIYLMIPSGTRQSETAAGGPRAQVQSGNL